MTVAWYHPYSNTLDRSALVVCEFNSGLSLPNEVPRRIYFEAPEKIRETKSSVDLSRARDYGWNENGASEFLSSAVLAERCVIQFVELVNRYQSGKIERRIGSDTRRMVGYTEVIQKCRYGKARH